MPRRPKLMEIDDDDITAILEAFDDVAFVGELTDAQLDLAEDIIQFSDPGLETGPFLDAALAVRGYAR